MTTDIVKEVTLTAPIQRVWAALTDAQNMQNWLGPDKQLKVDLKVGGKYAIFGGETTGIFTRIDAPILLEYTWRQSTWPAEWPDSVVRWEMEKNGSGTQIYLSHSKFPNTDERDSHDEGWDIYFLEPMTDYLDGGEE
jgi:uncharacterized protein YndB with AHSA1/START domain